MAGNGMIMPVMVFSSIHRTMDGCVSTVSVKRQI